MRKRLACVAGLLALPAFNAIPAQASQGPSSSVAAVQGSDPGFRCRIRSAPGGPCPPSGASTITVGPGESLTVKVATGGGTLTEGKFIAYAQDPLGDFEPVGNVTHATASDAAPKVIWKNDRRDKVEVYMEAMAANPLPRSGESQFISGQYEVQ
ncbi:hypothetical protein ABT294_15865 [Nonomuraea sp. NPDC000554]|uniref:hypothetical protein n=1 Tax=Nonomuraea sp. NPDC000554 TaxID=3154259 RepID=UPI0033187178